MSEFAWCVPLLIVHTSEAVGQYSLSISSDTFAIGKLVLYILTDNSALSRSSKGYVYRKLENKRRICWTLIWCKLIIVIQYLSIIKAGWLCQGYSTVSFVIDSCENLSLNVHRFLYL
jgi:type IV secretory pathway protease TraF